MINTIPAQCPIDEDITDFAEKLLSKVTFSQFPVDFVGGHLYGIANGYLAFRREAPRCTCTQVSVGMRGA